MTRSSTPTGVRGRTWVVLALLGAATGVAAVLLDLSPAVQALAFATSVGAATALARRRRGPAAGTTEVRPRPDAELEVERRVATLLEERPLARRALLVAAGLGLVGGATLLRLLGPRPARATAWDAGRRLVTSDGGFLRPEDVPEGSVTTVWPEGAIDRELTAVMLLRLREPPVPPTQLEHVVDGTVVAYSRICTHAGCPVALYRDRDQALFCPCHQATFDATAGARPTFGPASRPLPQLPMGTDDQGYLVALGDFDTLPGPPGGDA